jgi:ribosomal protein L11 methyltransferase
MQWIKFTLTTTTQAVDLISAAFDEIGIEGIEIEDNIPLTESETKGMFIDILPELPEDRGIAKVSFYLEPEQDIDEILKRVEEALDELSLFTDLRERKLVREFTADKDWINNWKEFFKPFMIGDILIKPTWEELPKDASYDTLIQIDPGTAFGTGSHETTRLCITELEKHIKELKAKEVNDLKVLDVGTGSGILGIAALKLGASYVFGTELDENAFEAIYSNMENNNIDKADFELVCGNIIDDEFIKDKAGYDKYDICVANILAPVIILLQKDIARHIKKGGVFITSGIIDTKMEEVKKALEENENFEISEINKLGEWYNITARRI